MPTSSHLSKETLRQNAEKNAEKVEKLRGELEEADRKVAVAEISSRVAVQREAEEERLVSASEQRAATQAQANQQLRIGLADAQGNATTARSHVESLEAKLAETAAALEKATRQLEELRQAQSSGLAGWLRSSAHQDAIALLAGFLALWAVAGPMLFVHVFKAVASSWLAGLMLAGCWGFFTTGGAKTWLDAFEAAAAGQGGFFEALLWLVLLVAGVARWYTGWEWLLYAVVDTAYVHRGRPVAECYLKTPLLGKRPAEEAKAATAAPKGQQPEAKAEEAVPEASTPDSESQQGGESSDQLGLVRVHDVVQRAIEDAYNAESPSKSSSHVRFWADISHEVVQGNVSAEVEALLSAYGFDRDRPAARMAVPQLQSLEELDGQLRHMLNMPLPPSDEV